MTLQVFYDIEQEKKRQSEYYHPDFSKNNTVNPLLLSTLKKLMESRLFAPFRLVGGTSLSLHLGHRQSVDIDLFSDSFIRKVLVRDGI